MNRLVLTALVLAPLAAPAARAQSPDAEPFKEGVRVKIRTATVHAAVGSIAQATADSIILHTDENGSRLAIPRAEITQTYRSQGKTATAGAKKGAVWGAGFGAVGAAMLAAPCKKSNGEKCDTSNHPNRSTGQIIATVFISETLFGTGLGALIKAEEWRETGAQSRVSLRPHGAGVAVAVSFR